MNSLITQTIHLSNVDGQVIATVLDVSPVLAPVISKGLSLPELAESLATGQIQFIKDEKES